MPVSATFARILAAGRPQFNAKAQEAKRRVPGFDQEILAAFLASEVDGLVSAVADALPDRAAPVALAAYDIAITLTAQGLVGPSAHKPLLGEAWHRLFPAVARHIAAAPTETIGALSNAALHLEQNPDLRGGAWLERLLALGPTTESPAQLLDLGKVLAWWAGAAHFRETALLVADRLPEKLALAALGAPQDQPWAEVRAELMANPWWSPSGEKVQERSIGKFSGFGGSFSRPPELRPADGGFWVKSGDRYSLLVADARGAVLHSASAEEFASAHPLALPATVALNGNRLTLSGRLVELDLPADGLSLTCNAHTLAVASPWSHHIHLFPLQ
jgi:hypothetical protein